MDPDPFEDSVGQFQEFDEQFLTYSNSSQIPVAHGNNRKIPTAPNSEKPKLKMIQEVIQKNTTSLFHNKKQRKNVSTNSKIVAIGDAIFRSNFESGNLSEVVKISHNAYEIYLTKEQNSDRTSAWFYFAVQGLKGENKFIVKGFTKTSSLYNSGMKICYKESEEGAQWRRGGTKISYTQSYCDDEEDTRQAYELQFSFFFKSSPNSVEFAYCFPYTYTYLINFVTLSKIRCDSLGKTYEGREMPILTIGNQQSKKVIVISARAHPGETVGSWMMHGFLKQLMESSNYSDKLREAFLFKIVPMINIDGVVNGNYRFSASGFDLNRKWKRCNPKMHPQIFHLKEMITAINKQKEVIMYIDLHGHSRQKNVFFYGCCPKGLTNSDGSLNTRPKQFPFLMSKLHTPFRYDFCSYAVQKQKQGTARICMWNQLKIDFVYTLEASFCGNEGGANYSVADYLKIGAKLCQGICIHFWDQVKQLAKRDDSQSGDKIEDQLKKNMGQFFQNSDLANVEFDGNSSDSEPEAGEIPIENRSSKKQNNPIAMQKYYKASKMIRFNEKSNVGLDEQNKYFKNKSQYDPVSRNESRRNKTNESIRLTKFSQDRKKVESKQENRSTHNNYNNSKSYNTSSLRKDLENAFDEASRNERNLKAQQDEARLASEATNQFSALDLLSCEKKERVNKKKAVSFEGAQYRRVRKMAEEHNRRHYSAHQQLSQDGEDRSLIKGLVGMNNLLEVDRIKPKMKSGASFFPNTTNASYKNRKNSMEMHFRRQIRANQYTSRRLQMNGAEKEVRCLGKQIF